MSILSSDIKGFTMCAIKPMGFASILKALLMFSATIAAIFVFYYAAYDDFGQMLPNLCRFYSSSGRNSSEEVMKDELYELRKVLEATSTKDKTVILTTLNEAWAAPNSIFDIFLESFKIGNNTYWLLNHLLVIAVDDKAYIYCQKMVSNCYFLNTNESSTMSNEAKFMTPIYLEMMWKRLDFLQTILSLGYNFIFTDTDVMWFRDPLPHFTLDSDFQTSCDRFNGKEFDIRNSPNNGFLFVRSNNRTINMYKFWLSSRHTYPSLHEQDVFNKIKNSTYIRQLGIKLRFLSTDYFGGFCSPSRDFNKVCTMHANCCVGLGRKIKDLNTTLENWKVYFFSNISTPQSFHWSVPKHCHM